MVGGAGPRVGGTCARAHAGGGPRRARAGTRTRAARSRVWWTTPRCPKSSTRRMRCAERPKQKKREIDRYTHTTHSIWRPQQTPHNPGFQAVISPPGSPGYALYIHLCNHRRAAKGYPQHTTHSTTRSAFLHPVEMSGDFVLGSGVTHDTFGWEEGTFPYLPHTSRMVLCAKPLANRDDGHRAGRPAPGCSAPPSLADRPRTVARTGGRVLLQTDARELCEEEGIVPVPQGLDAMKASLRAHFNLAPKV